MYSAVLAALVHLLLVQRGLRVCHVMQGWNVAGSKERALLATRKM